jgi:hypothetical protein
VIFIITIAKTTNAQISIAPEFGINFASLGIISSGKRISHAYSFNSPVFKYGIGAGGIIDYDFDDHIYIEPGLFYEMTGAKISENGANVTYNINTLEIPINAEYKFGKQKNGSYYFFGIGIYAADNISGKLSDGQSRTLDIGSAANDDIKAIDIGAGLNIGIVAKNHYLFRMHSQVGILNLSPASNSDNSIKTYAFGITIGYFVCGKKPKQNSSEQK